MNFKELRIGNYVSDNGLPMKVLVIYEDCIFCTFAGNQGDLIEFDEKHPCKPIKLTEDWLVEFGFEQQSKHYMKKDGVIIHLDDVFECFLGNHIVRLEYVHQIQNLFFELKRHELKLKP